MGKRQWAWVVVVPVGALGFAGTAHAEGIGHPRTDLAGAQVRVHEAGVMRGAAAREYPRGEDVSGHQKNVNWGAARRAGAGFAYVKATEGTTYLSPWFASQFAGSSRAGLAHGAYHFALPNHSSGRAQADWFVAHGGALRMGRTLPPALDIEYNPYGSSCYGLSKTAMTRWIAAFVGEVRARTGRYPAIFTSTRWWKACTGNTTVFARNHPLWLANWGSGPGTLPGGWAYETFWQYADAGKVPGDQDVFNGSWTGLNRLASG